MRKFVLICVVLAALLHLPATASENSAESTVAHQSGELTASFAGLRPTAAYTLTIIRPYPDPPITVPIYGNVGGTAELSFRIGEVTEEIFWTLVPVDGGVRPRGGIVVSDAEAFSEIEPFFGEDFSYGIRGFFHGDANGDWQITSADATALARHLADASTNIDRRAADINFDGVLCLADLTLLGRKLVGHDVAVGHQPNHLTIFPHTISGSPASNAQIVLYVDGARREYATQTGVISIGGIPEGSRVSYTITSHESDFSFSWDTPQFAYGFHIMRLSQSYLQWNGARVVKEINLWRGTPIFEVTLHLAENEGIWSFMTDLIFCPYSLTPLYIATANAIAGFYTSLPPSDGGRYENRRIFVSTAGGLGYSRETGVIATAVFRIEEHQGGGEWPIALGHLNVTITDPAAHFGISCSFAETCRELLARRGIPFDPPEIEPFHDPLFRTGRMLMGDANNDGRFTDADATLLENVLNWNPQWGINPNVERFYVYRSDMDFNWQVDRNDLAIMRAVLNGGNEPRPMMMMIRKIYNSDMGSAQASAQINPVFAYIPTVFRNELRTMFFNRLPYEVPMAYHSLNMRPGCAHTGLGHTCTPACGNMANGGDCAAQHHRSANHFIQQESLRHINTLRFVDFRLCSYRRATSTHVELGGVASAVGGNDAIVALRGPVAFRRWITAHEIAHLLGADDYRCHPDWNNRCVMSDFARGRAIIEWCPNCLHDIRRTRR